MINASPDDVTFRVNEGGFQTWRRAVDTSLASPDDILEPGSETPIADIEYLVKRRSLVVLLGKA
jgi:hypothetical protein